MGKARGRLMGVSSRNWSQALHSRCVSLSCQPLLDFFFLIGWSQMVALEMFYSLCHWVSELMSSVSVAGKPSDSILDSRLHRISKSFGHCAVPTQLSSGTAHVTYRKRQLHSVCDNCCGFCPDVSQHFGLWWTLGTEPITSCYLMRPNHGCTFSNPLGMQAWQLLFPATVTCRI